MTNNKLQSFIDNKMSFKVVNKRGSVELQSSENSVTMKMDVKVSRKTLQRLVRRSGKKMAMPIGTVEVTKSQMSLFITVTRDTVHFVLDAKSYRTLILENLEKMMSVFVEEVA